MDYDLIRSTNPDFNKALVRINVKRGQRQLIQVSHFTSAEGEWNKIPCQYIHPSDAVKLGVAELLVVDEAAAIPLPILASLISGTSISFIFLLPYLSSLQDHISFSSLRLSMDTRERDGLSHSSFSLS